MRRERWEVLTGVGVEDASGRTSARRERNCRVGGMACIRGQAGKRTWTYDEQCHGGETVPKDHDIESGPNVEHARE